MDKLLDVFEETHLLVSNYLCVYLGCFALCDSGLVLYRVYAHVSVSASVAAAKWFVVRQEWIKVGVFVDLTCVVLPSCASLCGALLVLFLFFFLLQLFTRSSPPLRLPSPTAAPSSTVLSTSCLLSPVSRCGSVCVGEPRAPAGEASRLFWAPSEKHVEVAAIVSGFRPGC